MEQQDEECHKLNHTKNNAVKICYTICIEFGCNSANIRLSSPVLVVLLPIIVSVLGFGLPDGDR